MIPDRLLQEVQNIFAGDFGGHDWAHTERVMRLAARIAQAEGADAETVALAALLHDVDDYKLTGGDFGACRRADSLMQRHGIPAARRTHVCDIIRAVSYKASETVAPPSLEGKVVQDADRLDAMGAVGIARAFAFGGSRNRPMFDGQPPALNMTAEEYRRRKSSTINHFYEKLLLLKDLMNMPTARALAEVRHGRMVRFLDDFRREWNGEC